MHLRWSENSARSISGQPHAKKSMKKPPQGNLESRTSLTRSSRLRGLRSPKTARQ